VRCINVWNSDLDRRDGRVVRCLRRHVPEQCEREPPRHAGQPIARIEPVHPALDGRPEPLRHAPPAARVVAVPTRRQLHVA
jgi:hypothetical protein